MSCQVCHRWDCRCPTPTVIDPNPAMEDELTQLRAEVAELRKKASRWDTIETLMIIGNVDLTQAEEGGYNIYVEPVENLLLPTWTGDTPEEVVDSVVAAIAKEKEHG